MCSEPKLQLELVSDGAVLEIHRRRKSELVMTTQGAFGRATLVRNKNGDSYVVKEINLATMPATEREMARTEIKVLRNLAHHNVIRCF